MGKYKLREIQYIAEFNPSEQLPKGSIAKNVPMALIKEFERKIAGYEISEYKSGAKFRNRDTLLAKITPCLENGKTAFVDILDNDEVAFGSTEFIVLRAKENTDAEFLYYFSRSPAFRKKAISCMEGTSGRQRVNEGTLKLLELPIPEFKTQQKIAKILTALDRKIALNNQINSELEKMAKTLYDYWFVQFDFPDENGKPYKSSGGKMVWNEVLKREVPLGWGDGIIENNLAKVPNSNKIQSKEIKCNGKIPVIDQSQDYICGFTNDDDSILIPNDAHIIFGDHTRKVKLVNFPYARGADGTQVIISNNERLPNYLFYQMILEIDLSNYGYARHYKFLKESRILVPSKDIAQKFNQKASSFFDLWKRNLKQNQTLTQYRDFLLPMLMNGQVEIL
ncbi:restriction endonuclease subunit S [Glaesserella parasuis]|nr:restriction endonuclease subunit S [Glaesserella parasuis]MDE3970755.1 restriction endonuclease subunit S [Glaesserella parasuis]